MSPKEVEQLMSSRKKPGAPESRRPLKGNLLVITGPSGVGKGTVLQRLLEVIPKLTKSVSVTTREIRPGEAEGIDYFFRTRKQFAKMLEENNFLEHAEFAGNLYGTPRAWVEHELRQGRDVILEIEVKGARQVREKFPTAVLVFLSPPSFDALRSRLKIRGTETPMKMALRLTQARQEMRSRGDFDYEVVNDDINDAVNNLGHIVYAERCRIREHEDTSSPNEHN
jgi:guanylate kinase